MGGRVAEREHRDAVVVGGGQTGLAASHYLRRSGLDHVVLDERTRVGDVWRTRWDSLRLFTSARYDGLPGMPFPAAPGVYPTKDQIADYFEAYVEKLGLPVRLGSRVESLTREGGSYVVRAGGVEIETPRVIVATGGQQTAREPAIASDLDPAIEQLHSSHYRRPEQLPAGDVLVVGAGTSGVEIAIDAARDGHATWLAGRGNPQVPAFAQRDGGRTFWFVANHVLSLKSPIGRRVRAKISMHGSPLVRTTLKDAERAGARRVPSVTGVRDGLPLVEDGQVLKPASIVWCTGYGVDHSWIDLPLRTDGVLPVHDRGLVRDQPGLAFLGLPFLTRLASILVGGADRDAAHVVAELVDGSAGRRP